MFRPVHPSARRGFTIVELMGTMVLIGLLAAIALPAYRGHVDKARTAAAAGEIAEMSAAINAYFFDHRTLPDTLAAVRLDGRVDPWGRPYVFYNVEANGRGGARKDHALNPINTDYDLYSVGADGETKKQVSQKDSLDDVIRANNGAFIGVASSF